MSLTYTVKYKKIGCLFFKKIKNVKGDFIATDVPGGHRVLILENETRIEIPTNGMIFLFSNERFLMIKQQMEQEVGQKIPIKSSTIPSCKYSN